MDYSIDVARSGERATVFLAGEVDLETSPDLRQTLVDLADEVATIVVNASRLEFIDSTGLAALLAAHKAMGAKGGRFEIDEAPPMLVRMIGIVGLDGILAITPRERDDG